MMADYDTIPDTDIDQDSPFIERTARALAYNPVAISEGADDAPRVRYVADWLVLETLTGITPVATMWEFSEMIPEWVTSIRLDIDGMYLDASSAAASEAAVPILYQVQVNNTTWLTGNTRYHSVTDNIGRTGGSVYRHTGGMEATGSVIIWRSSVTGGSWTGDANHGILVYSSGFGGGGTTTLTAALGTPVFRTYNAGEQVTGLRVSVSSGNYIAPSTVVRLSCR